MKNPTNKVPPKSFQNINIAILGANQSGKSQFIYQIKSGNFIQSYVETIAVEYFQIKKDLSLPHQQKITYLDKFPNAKILIWDISSLHRDMMSSQLITIQQGSHNNLTTLQQQKFSYKSVDAFIFFYDITKPSSFEQIVNLKKTIQREFYEETHLTAQNMLTFTIANKIDLCKMPTSVLKKQEINKNFILAYTKILQNIRKQKISQKTASFENSFQQNNNINQTPHRIKFDTVENIHITESNSFLQKNSILENNQSSVKNSILNTPNNNNINNLSQNQNLQLQQPKKITFNTKNLENFRNEFQNNILMLKKNVIADMLAYCLCTEQEQQHYFKKNLRSYTSSNKNQDKALKVFDNILNTIYNEKVLLFKKQNQTQSSSVNPFFYKIWTEDQNSKIVQEKGCLSSCSIF